MSRRSFDKQYMYQKSIIIRHIDLNLLKKAK